MMSLGIVLNESDLREMPPALRTELLRWYFERSPSGGGFTSVNTQGTPPVAASERQREERGRATFPEVKGAGLLAPGDELLCKTLRRQQRDGAEQFIEAGRVQPDGSVEYRGKRYTVPSILARAVINANGGNTKAVNGYDYLFVRTPSGVVPLEKLRVEFIHHFA
jgi:hypothetical protein